MDPDFPLPLESSSPTAVIVGDVVTDRLEQLPPATRADVLNSLQFAAIVAARADAPREWLRQLLAALASIGWALQSSAYTSAEIVERVAVCRVGSNPTGLDVEVIEVAEPAPALRGVATLVFNESVFSTIRPLLEDKLGVRASRAREES